MAFASYGLSPTITCMSFTAAKYVPAAMPGVRKTRKKSIV